MTKPQFINWLAFTPDDDEIKQEFGQLRNIQANYLDKSVIEKTLDRRIDKCGVMTIGLTSFGAINK